MVSKEVAAAAVSRLQKLPKVVVKAHCSASILLLSCLQQEAPTHHRGHWDSPVDQNESVLAMVL
jgi:hypothetical protein